MSRLQDVDRRWHECASCSASAPHDRRWHECASCSASAPHDRRTRIVTALLLSILLLAIGACGGGHAATAPTARVSQQRATLLRVGTSGNYPPLSEWTGARPDGFAPALVEAFAKTDRTELAWSRFRWPDLAS